MSDLVRRILITLVAVAVAGYIFWQIEMDPLMAVIIIVLGVARVFLPSEPRFKPARLGIDALILLWAIVLPLFHDAGQGFIDDANVYLPMIVMALGLNIVVGFAGLLDLGYVAFFAFGAFAMGWFGSSFFANINDGNGLHIFVSERLSEQPGIHANFLLVVIAAIVLTAVAGALIGLPTLRLRGDYIAIVTLAFGEIIGRIAINGDEIGLGSGETLTGGRQGITPVDKIDLPGTGTFEALNLRPWYWAALGMVLIVLFVNFRLRDSRLGRAWIALREDEVAAASMGVPLVRTKLLAYATGAAFGGIAGAFLASYHNTVNADQFQFYFSVVVLGSIILGGLGSIWGCVVGAIALAFINFTFMPDIAKDWPQDIGLDFDMTELFFAIFGFLLVFMMILRPEGLIPERRRQLELTHGIGETEMSGGGMTYEVRG
jgi:branched-chain amino acid transport system permease protein